MTPPVSSARPPGCLARLVRLFGLYVRDGGIGAWLPLYRSMNEPPDGDEDGWQRWELVFAHLRSAKLSPRGKLGPEPRFYRWRYDGRVRWRLWLTSTYFAAWGRDYTDLPNAGADTRRESPPPKPCT